MKTSSVGISLIKEFEGFRAVPYEDLNGNPTLGFGHKILKGEVFGALSVVEATALLERDVQRCAEDFIDRLVKCPLTQNEYDALSSFVYNIGGGAFSRSTLLLLINSDQKEKAPEEILKWCKAGGSTSNGLVRRRKKESDLFKNT